MCACKCYENLLVLNALVIVNVWAYVMSLVFCSFRGFTYKCTRFCLDVSFYNGKYVYGVLCVLSEQIY